MNCGIPFRSGLTEIDAQRAAALTETTPGPNVPERPPDSTLSQSPSDADVIARVLSGDLASFELIMRRHNQRLFRVARSVVRSNDEAEEIVQESYLRAYRRLDQLKDRNRFSSWITQIVFHESLASRRRSRRMVATDLSAPQHAAMDGLTVHHDVGEEASVQELRAVLTKAVDALPDDLRTVFTLRLIEELNTEDTADCLNLTVANVKVRLHRARTLLQERIDGQIGAHVRQLHQFGGERCDRIVHSVLDRLRDQHECDVKPSR
jgi:RNA polymerase sigma-70 factor (ECF subfamily)